MDRMTCGTSLIKHAHLNDRREDNVQSSSSSSSSSSLAPVIKTAPSRIAAVAGQDSAIQAGARSPDITIHTPLDVSTVFWEETNGQPSESLEVTLENGKLASKRASWMKHVQLSSNCHTQNLQIVAGQKGNLFLETTRDIGPGERLYAWFSMETAKVFNIPFLSLHNILGDRHYRCHLCHVQYQNPNPLKIHLAFFCHRPIPHQNTEQPAPIPYPIFPGPGFSANSCSAFTSVRPTASTSAIMENLFPRSFAHGGHPIVNLSGQTTLVATSNIPLSLMSDIFHHSMPSYVYEPLVSIVEANQNPSANLPPMSDVAPAATAAMGRQKRRHKCPYCDKLYSRKYGLKIHVRTHTGYKPLKCKVCLRPFGDPSNLNKHVRLHAQGLTPYRCDLCGKVLVRRRDLDRHLKSRHPNDEAAGERLSYPAIGLIENIDLTTNCE